MSNHIKNELLKYNEQPYNELLKYNDQPYKE